MKRTNTKKQRGSALLLTLGILSMALVMAMCFAFTARTSLQVAQVNSDITKARLMAECGLQRVMAIMYNETNTASLPYYYAGDSSTGNFKFVQGANGNRTLRFMMSVYPTEESNTKYEETLRDDLIKASAYLPWLDSLTTTNKALDGAKHYGYQPVRDSDHNILGRIGYIVIDETDRLDINQMMPLLSNGSTWNSPFVKKGENMFASLYRGTSKLIYQTDDFPYNLVPNDDGYVDDNQASPQTIRMGKSLRELWFSSRSNYFSSRICRDSTRYEFAPFSSYRQLKNIYPAFVTDNDYLKYTFFSGKDIEAYWDSTNKIERQRFDLSGYEWRSGTAGNGWDDIWETDALTSRRFLVDKLVNSVERPAFYDEENPADVKKPTGTFDSGTGFGIPGITTQIAANMVDFCDSDSYATYKITATDLLAVTADSEVTYFGNDYAPYINEFGLSFKVSRVAAPNPDHETKRTFQLFVKPYFELLNIYPKRGLAATPAGKAKIVITGTLQKTIADGTPEDIAWPGGESDKWVIDTEYAESNGVAFLQPDISESAFESFTTGKDDSVTYTVNITSINMVTFESGDATIDGAKIFDFAYWKPTAPQELSIPLNVSAADSTAYTTGFSIQVSDPRLNHQTANWECTPVTGATETTATDLSCFTAGAKNTNCTGAGGDLENSTLSFTQSSPEDDSCTFSTAFIPNRPFKSVWELGCIHTGTAFKTLDILDADKEIVDKVKVGPLKIRKDTYNINASNTGCAFELFKNIDITRGYWFDYSGADASTNGPYAGETSTISSETNVSGFEFATAPSFNRSVAAEKFKSLASSAPNKRQQEALYGRTVELLSTRVCRYTILVTAEALRQIDIPDAQWDATKSTIKNAITDENDYYKKFKCQSLGKQRILAHVVHDTWRNTFEIVQMEYLDWED